MKTILFGPVLVSTVLAQLNHVKEWISMPLIDTHHGWFYTNIRVGSDKEDFKVILDTSFSGLAIHTNLCAECGKDVNLYYTGNQ